jgi:hypothetical protein
MSSGAFRHTHSLLSSPLLSSLSLFRLLWLVEGQQLLFFQFLQAIVVNDPADVKRIVVVDISCLDSNRLFNPTTAQPKNSTSVAGVPSNTTKIRGHLWFWSVLQEEEAAKMDFGKRKADRLSFHGPKT